MNILTMGLDNLSGIGEKRRKEFSLMGVKSVYDLLYYFPARYQDRSVFSEIDSVYEGKEVCIKATLKSKIKNIRVRKNLLIAQGRIFDDSGEMDVIWYNNRFIEKTLKAGESYVFFGKISLKDKKQVFINPVTEQIKNTETYTGKIIPVYKTSGNINQKTIQKAVNDALSLSKGLLTDVIPKSVREKYEIYDIEKAINNVHFPESEESAIKARKRFVFEELFLFQASLYKIRQNMSEGGIKFIDTDTTSFREKFGYKFTNAQEKVSLQIKKDFASGKAMKRLIQGDVGSGKTAICFEGAYLSAKNGFQTAIMAPTEILARQHYEKAQKQLGEFSIGLLTSSVKKSEKIKILQQVKNGEIDILIGTHALIEADVTFKNLALVIADEQHRFGVRQRQKLIEKGENPHLMVMTATPIPRTLSIIMYGDLNVSVIDELPPGRQKIKTYLVGEAMHERVYSFIKKQAEMGQKTYVVCPMVEENEQENLKSAVNYSKLLAEKLLPLKVGLIHGKMKDTEKNEAMDNFKSGDTTVLVSTTVIEVGVDVPSAGIMVIENAERFGLSQLHQLRGRVGRGGNEAFCIMFTSSKSNETIKKLRVIESSTDGFYISEQDLLLRGPGDYFGTRQSGLPPIKNSNPISEVELLYKSKEAWEMVVNKTLEVTDTEKQLIIAGIENMVSEENNCNIIN